MRRLVSLLALLPFFALAACGGSSDHNDADVTFARDMVPHHQQAVQMADMVAGAGASPDVEALAKQIKAAQAPEIDQMKGWLDDWDVKTGGMGNMDMGSDGMMSGSEMSRLGQATGAGFDRLWLQLMTRHHEGAITMAKTEIKDGSSSDAKALAKKIIAAQEKEIATMKGLLG